MSPVCAHFPVSIVIQENNFLGKSGISWVWVWMTLGVDCSVFQAENDELILEENGVELVSVQLL